MYESLKQSEDDMNKQSRFNRWAFAGLFVIVCLTCGPSLLFGDIERSFNVGPGGQLTLESDIGSIEVRSHSRNTVDIDVVIESRRGGGRRVDDFMEEFDIDFRHDGNDVTVIAEYQRDRWNFWDSIGKYIRVRFYVNVPKKYNVDLKTSGGGISVDDLEGKVYSKTSGGSLEFGRIKGPVKGKTSGGSIRLTSCEGKADVNTSGGSITIGSVSGDVYAHTSGGSIHVEEVMGMIDATTSGGSVTASITRQPDYDCRLTTSGGGITVHLAKDIKVNLNASTSGGRVRTDFPVTIRGEISKRSLRAKINGGGPELYLRTSGGSIYIREL